MKAKLYISHILSTSSKTLFIVIQRFKFFYAITNKIFNCTKKVVIEHKKTSVYKPRTWLRPDRDKRSKPSRLKFKDKTKMPTEKLRNQLVSTIRYRHSLVAGTAKVSYSKNPIYIKTSKTFILLILSNFFNKSLESKV